MRRQLVSIVASVLVVATAALADPDPVTTDGSRVQVSMPPFALHTTNDTQYHSLNGHAVILSLGEALVEAKETGVVVTPLALTYMKKGSIVLFRVAAGLEREMVLWDNSHLSVVAVSQKSAARLGAGDEVVVSDHKPYYREISQSDVIGRREVRRFFVGNGLYMTTTEFSLPHALKRSGLLSSTDRSDMALSRKIIKTSVILDSMNSRRHPYVTPEPLDSKRFEPSDPISAYEDLLPEVEDHSSRGERER